MNDYRHVCFKDLENYFNKKDLFSGLNEDEQSVIRTNIGAASLNDLRASMGGIIVGTYAEIKEIADDNDLSLLCKYVITDFQTIYRSNTNEIWGLSVNPSEVYSIVLTPISGNKFDKRVSIMNSEGVALDWIVNYEFQSEALSDTVNTKGKITYLKDQNNNSAYYDFKNIRTNFSLRASEVTGLSTSGDYALYTFSKIVDGQIVDSSNDSNIINNEFDYDCCENAFLGVTSNNQFCGGFKENLFTRQCMYNKFEWDTTGNKFTTNIRYSQGSIKNALVNTNSYDNAVSKEFRMLESTNSSSPVFVVTYLDGSTLTNQVIRLNSNQS